MTEDQNDQHDTTDQPVSATEPETAPTPVPETTAETAVPETTGEAIALPATTPEPTTEPVSLPQQPDTPPLGVPQGC